MKIKIVFLISLLIALLTFLFTPSTVLAKKKLNLSSKSQKSVTNVWIKPKLRADHHSLLLMLGGMNYADSLSYVLTYTSGEVGQGVEGTHNPADGNTIKELLFGTCSNTDCTYHQDIANMILEVIIKLQSGQTITQKYQITP